MNDVTAFIRQQLFALQDLSYREFHRGLIPTVNPDTVIGVRAPALRRLAKEVYKNHDFIGFLRELPHTYYDENNLHGFLVCEMTDYDKTIDEIDRFLPFVDNWATCDLLRPKAFRRAARQCPDRLEADIRRWMSSSEPYTIRFGIEMLMTFFLESAENAELDGLNTSAMFQPEYLDWVAAIANDHYYVRMMVAWFFATALAKQYDATLPYIEHYVLPAWTHRKSIQKAIESLRLTPDQKSYLKTLR